MQQQCGSDSCTVLDQDVTYSQPRTQGHCPKTVQQHIRAHLHAHASVAAVSRVVLKNCAQISACASKYAGTKPSTGSIAYLESTDVLIEKT
jgi:hypothetical protein